MLDGRSGHILHLDLEGTLIVHGLHGPRLGRNFGLRHDGLDSGQRRRSRSCLAECPDVEKRGECDWRMRNTEKKLVQESLNHRGKYRGKREEDIARRPYPSPGSLYHFLCSPLPPQLRSLTHQRHLSSSCISTPRGAVVVCNFLKSGPDEKRRCRGLTFFLNGTERVSMTWGKAFCWLLRLDLPARMGLSKPSPHPSFAG